MKLARIVLLFGAWLVLQEPLHGQDYSIRHFHPENGLNGTYVYATIEDSEGYKWIGTETGLARFDGLSFERIDHNDSTQTNFPTSALNTTNGSLLFGYYNGMIKEFDGRKLKTIYSPEKNGSPIRSLIENDSLIWGLTQNHGIIRIEQGQSEVFLPRELQDLKSSILIIQNGLALVGTNEGLLVFRILPDKTLGLSEKIKGLEKFSIQALIKSQLLDSFWVGTAENGLFELTMKLLESGEIEVSNRQAGFLQGKSVTAIREARNQDLWVGTKYAGLIRVNFNRDNTKPIQFTRVSSHIDFPGDQISSIFLDKDENAWIGTVGDGLIQVHRKGLIFYNFERFRVKSVNSISGTKDHKFLFGTDAGLILGEFFGNVDSLQFKLIDHPLIKDKEVMSVYTDKHDRIYFSIKDEGLFFTDSHFEKVYSLPFKHDLSKITIRQIVEDGDSLLWLSVKKNGVFVIDLQGNIKAHYATKTGFYHNEIYHIKIDSKGNKWFASHSAGLAVLKKNSSMKYLTKEEVFPARDINDISEDESGNIWIGTSGSGIFEYDGKDFIHFSKQDGLLSDYTNSVMSDRNNHIWVSHRTGLSRLDEGTNAISTIQEKDGLMVTEFIQNSIFRDQDHNIWLGNRNGVTFLHTPDEMFESKVLETIVTDVKINHKSADLYDFSLSEKRVGKIPERMVFPYTYNNLTFEYVAINLKNPKSNLYQFKLEGYEQEWSPTTKANSIHYTNLNPGKYKFLIRQSDNPNHWGDNITQLSFTITPAWWNTWWAKSLLFVAVVILLSAVIRTRTLKERAKLKRKMMFLEITEDQNRRLKNFSFITSHNTRASVGNILGLIDAMENNPDNKEYFTMLKSSANKLDTTVKHINNLLNFENELDEHKKVDCNLLETINRVISLNDQMIDRSGALIEVNIPKDAKVKAIPAYLDSIFNNLITNALKYGITDVSKTIKIHMEVLGGDQTVILVEDNGLGIDMEKHRKKLFKLGSRFHSSRSDGHGLGLYMSKNQIEAMDGKIEIDSTVDVGTIVSVSLETS